MQNLYFDHALLPDGWAKNVRISVDGGVIAAITPDAIPESKDERHAIALPGLPNLHSHTFQRAIAGLTETRGPGPDSFWSWREMMYRFALKMTPEQVEAVATLAFVEMLESGFSAVAEFHYLHHAPDGTPYDNIAEMATRIAAAAAATGISLLLLPVFYAHAGFGGLPPAPAQRRFINNLDQYEKMHDACGKLAPTGIAPHSLRAVTPEELARLIGLNETNQPFHIHISEQMQEVADCIAWSGAPPITWLLNHAEIGSHWCLIHATHADADERSGIAAISAVTGLCPVTEANLGDGIFHLNGFTGAFGVGTDSNVLIGAAEELRLLEYAQRLLVRQRNVLTATSCRATGTAMLQACVTGGAQALGRKLSGLRAGAAADIVTLATTRLGPAAADPDSALNLAIFANRDRCIETVWAGGHKCVIEGRHPMAAAARKNFDSVVAALL
jgi:formimidoylglutamate deiminase